MVGAIPGLPLRISGPGYGSVPCSGRGAPSLWPSSLSVLFALSPILVGAAHDGQLFSTGIYTKVKSQGAKLMSFGVPFMCVDKLEQTFIRTINNKVNSNSSVLNKIAQLIIESR